MYWFKISLISPDYQRHYFLYLDVAISIIAAMVFIQEDDMGIEHPIYYLSWNLNNTEIQYTHVEKLALVVVQSIHIFRHYTFLWKTKIISDCNPMNTYCQDNF